MKDTEAKPYTYLIHWTDYGMSYYGFRCGNHVEPSKDLWQKYFTSSQHVKRFRKEFGEPDIIRIDRIFDDKVEAKLYETEYLRSVGVPGNLLWLNRSDGSKNFFHGNKHSEESRQLMIDAAKRKGPRKPVTAETRAKLSAIHKGKPKKPHSEATKRKMSLIQTGKIRSAESRNHISDAKKGMVFSQAHKDAIRQAKIENPWIATEEQRAKISVANTGRKQTPEWIEKKASKVRGNKYGPPSNEHRSKVSASLKGVPKPPRSSEHTKRQQEARLRTLAAKKLVGALVNQ